jgi:hypothetical protein
MVGMMGGPAVGLGILGVEHPGNIQINPKINSEKVIDNPYDIPPGSIASLEALSPRLNARELL